MADCPNCKGPINESETSCPHCGKHVIPGDKLEYIQVKTSLWQKIVIAAGLVILIGIGFTFMGAEKRENKAAEANFSGPVKQIITSALAQTGLGQYGLPVWSLDAKTKSADVYIEFPRGPIDLSQVVSFGQGVCRSLARAYVNKGYMPRSLAVHIASTMPNGSRYIYGTASYNGNLDVLGWENYRR